MGFIVCFSLAGCYIQFNSQRKLGSKSGAQYLSSVACVLLRLKFVYLKMLLLEHFLPVESSLNSLHLWMQCNVRFNKPLLNSG